MKLKNITPAQISDVKAHRAILQKQLETMADGSKRLEKLLSQQSDLEAQIRELEGAAPSKDNARALADARAELELCSRRLGEIKPNDSATDTALHNLMNEARQILNDIFPPTIKDFLNPIVSAIRPFTRADGEAEKLARDTGAYKALKARLYQNFTLAHMIARYDEILAGEIAWNFNPKIS